MKNIAYLITVALFALGLGACDLEQEINLDLPVYESQVVVECYLEPGQPFQLLLSQSAAYFDPFPGATEDFIDQILMDDAEVAILHKGETIPLENGVFFNFFTGKLFNYQAVGQFVPADYNEDFELLITTADGQTITAKTQILAPVPIDSVVIEFDNQEENARALTYFADDLTTNNYYRRMLHQSSLDSLPDQDFALNDDFVENGSIVFGTGFDFERGDTVINTLFHIERDYFDFLNSLANAVASNGNPFGQPGVIKSNIEGNAIGIFTGLSYDREMTIVE
jgi:hypothetical protein